MANYVPINGITTINNTKTFTSSPIVPSATLDGHAVNLGQVNSLITSDAIQNLSLGIKKGEISISNGNSVKLDSLTTAGVNYNILDFFNEEANITQGQGLKVFRTTYGATGVPAQLGGGILFQRNSLHSGGNTLEGSFALFKSHGSSDKLYLSTGTGFTTMSDWRIIATEDWVTQQIGDISIPTVNNGTLTLSTGSGLTGSGSFSANQSGNSSFSVGIASTHKLPSITEWNALPTTDTITRLRGTTSGTYTSGDLTLLPGSNVTISQSGSNFTISATDTNTTYSAGTGLSLSGTTFGQTITTNGTGTFITGITQTTNGFQVNLGTPPNTTYSAGSGLTLSGTTFSLPITYSGSGDYIANIVQNTNGLTVTRATLPAFNDAITSISRNGVDIPISNKNVDIPIFSTSGAGLVPPRVGSVATKYLREDGTWVTPTNTTYSAGTLALLQEGTNATNRVWSTKTLADGVIRKGVHNVNPDDQPFSIHANYGSLNWNGNGFSFFTDSEQEFSYIEDEQAIGVNPFQDYGCYFSYQRLRFTADGNSSELLPSNGVSRSKLPTTGSTQRTLTVGATMGGSTYYANDNGIINLPNINPPTIDTTVKMYLPGDLVNNDYLNCNASKTIVYLSASFVGPLTVEIDPTLQDGSELIMIHTYGGDGPGLFNIYGDLIDHVGQFTSMYQGSQGKTYRFVYVKDYERFALVAVGQI